ncbi:Pre-mRNA splicing, partial [Coemansia sp. RSA 2523]
MSDEFTEEHKKLYQYAGNSNLVLPSDRKGARRTERGKEVESLWSKIDPRDMGSQVRREAPQKPTRTDADELKSQERKHARRAKQQVQTNYGFTDILAATEDMEGMYRPRTQETRQVWDKVLAQTRVYLGDQTPEVLMSAADEALGVLKNEELKDMDKKKQVEQLFGATVGEAEFSRFVQLARQITDFGAEEEDEGDQRMDVDEGGIAV